MRKEINWIVRSLALAVLVFAGGYGLRPAFVSAWEWPKSIAVATPQVGTAQYANTLAWGSILEQKAGMKVQVIGMPGTVDRHKMVKSGKVLMAADWPEDARLGLEAMKGYASKEAGPFNMRIVWTSSISDWGFPVLSDSPIKSLKDLKGRRIAWYAGSPMFVVAVEALLHALGLDKKDVTLVPVSDYRTNIIGIAERKFDTAYVSPHSGITFELDATPVGIRWLPIPTAEEDPEFVKRWLSVNPVQVFGKCSLGVKSAVGVPMIVQPQFYVTKAETDPDLIYHLVKWLDENYPFYKDVNPTAQLLDIKTFKSKTVDGVFVPMSEGTVRYLKEKNLWSPENEKRQAKYTTLIRKYVEAFDEAVKATEKENIKMGTAEWERLWASYKEKFGLRGLP